MNKFLEKLTKLELLIASEKGPFDLFALLLREDDFDRWDLVASATWIDKDYNYALDYVTKKLNSALTTDELLKVSKVVLIDEFDERVRGIQKLITVEHKPTELREINFFGRRVDLVFVITSKLRADNALLKVVWDVLTEMWQNGERAVYSGKILETLKKTGQSVPLGALRRVFEFLVKSRCIRVAKFVDRDGIREHGAMTVSWINPFCAELDSYFDKQEKICLLGLHEDVIDSGYEKWVLVVEDVVEHQAPILTYHLHFINQNDLRQERELDLTISHRALATERKDQYHRPNHLRRWLGRWLSDKKPVQTVNFDEEVALQEA